MQKVLLGCVEMQNIASLQNWFSRKVWKILLGVVERASATLSNQSRNAKKNFVQANNFEHKNKNANFGVLEI
jgi:hypothetical protein